MMRSLENRLLASLTALLIVAGLVAGLVAYRLSFNEAIEVQDSVLLQVGAIASEVRATSQPGEIGRLEPEARVMIEEIADAPDKAELQPLADGLHIVTRAGRPWRLLIRTRADGSRVAIGQPIDIRNRIARSTATSSVLPLTVLFPCLMLVVAVVIRKTMQPIALVAERLDAGQADHLQALPLEDAPSELRPFISSINRLLARLQTLIIRQRRFIADAAHELRTPITAISLQAENLDHVAFQAESHERLQALKAGTRRTAHLLEQLLALARYDMGAMSDAAVTALASCAMDVVADLMPVATERNIDLGFDGIVPVSVRAESIMMSVLIRNLIDNALRHTPPHGRVDIRLRQQRDRAILTVEDSGPGIPEADFERIFEPFVRGSHAGEGGIGLGLSIVSRIVERVGGTIQLQNLDNPGRSGLRVIANLPAAG